MLGTLCRKHDRARDRKRKVLPRAREACIRDGRYGFENKVSKFRRVGQSETSLAGFKRGTLDLYDC